MSNLTPARPLTTRPRPQGPPQPEFLSCAPEKNGLCGQTRALAILSGQKKPGYCSLVSAETGHQRSDDVNMHSAGPQTPSLAYCEFV
jgi:hypothetical protein